MATVVHPSIPLLRILGAGAQTPVGRQALASAAAVRCGISRCAEHPFMIDRYGEPMVVARADWLDEDLPVDDRIVALAAGAAHEALAPIASDLRALRCRLGIHIALSSETFRDRAARQVLGQRIAAEAGVAVRAAEAVACVAEGHAGGLLALERACHQIRHGETDICLVGGADSYLDPVRLQALDRSNRLHSKEVTWGITPGEGAAFCLVTTDAFARDLRLSPLGDLAAVCTAREQKVMGNDTICIGEGLTAAFRGVLDPRRPVSHCYCDLNGEPYRADEYGFAITRTGDCFEDAGRFTAAARSWGDVGAASGILALALALAAFSRGYADGPTAMVWSSSAHLPLRAAALISRSETRRR